MSSLALRGAIYQYLQSEHPSVARKMKAKILLENDDSDEDEVELCNAKSAIVKKYGPKATFSTVLEAEYKSLVPEAGTRRARSASAPPKSSSRAASTSAATKTKKSPLVAPVATATKKAAVDSSDSDSDSSDAIVPPRRVVINKVLPKKASPKLSPVVAPAPVAKKKIAAAAADSSDSDSDDVPPPAAAITKKRSVSKPKSVSPALKPVAVAKKTSTTKTAVALSSSSDDDDAQPMKVVNNKQQEQQQQNYNQEEGQEEEQYVKKQSYANSKFDNINLVHPSYRSQKGMGGVADKEKFGDRFCRIDLEGVKYRDDRLKDNMPGQEATGFLQNRKMMAVRGKEFNKHKQKNKAKLYAAGVDQTIRSVKFENWSDSD